MRRAVALVLASLVVCPTLAIALDVPISGAKLLLKQSSSGKQKLVFQSKDSSFPFPEVGSSNDPSTHAATIEIITPGAPIGGPFVAPSNAVQPGWTTKTATVSSYKYERDKAYAATTSIKSIVIKRPRHHHPRRHHRHPARRRARVGRDSHHDRLSAELRALRRHHRH